MGYGIWEDSDILVERDVEKFFRPSNLPVLNDRFAWRFFDDYFGKQLSEIKIPEYLISTPEDLVINYFSILREANDPQEGKAAGCGSIGTGKAPYPVTYHFLSSDYQKKLSYEEYLKLFENIYHISLIKYREVPLYDNPNQVTRYFFEIETIQGSENLTANFVYYYGFMDMTKEEDHYKVSNIDMIGENYLCAPYHGWSYDAEASVQVKYGAWCSLIQELYPTIQKGYIKNISFQGTDHKEYLIVFYQLTNDTDIEVAQYVKSSDDTWSLTKLEPEKCISVK